VEEQGEGSVQPTTAGRGGGVHRSSGARAGEKGAVREGGGGAWVMVALGCWAVCYGPRPVNSATSDLFKKNQTNLNLIRSKDGLPKLNFFEIKYGIKGN
jgi:hypothetical protein